MSEWILSSSILILIVIALRTCFKGKISLRLQYAIWGLVLIRLLIPFSFGSTNFSVANLTSNTEAPTIAVQPAEPNEHVQADIPEQHQQTQPNDIPSQTVAQSEPETKKLFVERSANVFNIVWGIGFVSIAGLFLFTNLRFKNRILRSRHGMNVRKNKLDVYVSSEIDTPCLFGVKNPAIYVTYTVADDQTLLRHTLEHEATHYRHGDHIWTVLRCVCLAVHWYNPLVWWAAFLSQRDAELACDEATIQRLGEEERAEYGRTLIGMTCQKKTNVLITATTMATSKSGLKERIMLIARKPKMALYTLLTVLLVASIAVGCTFTGAKEPEQGANETLPSPTETENGERIYGDEQREELLDKRGEEIMGTETPDDAPPVNQPELFAQELDDDKVCIAVLPTGISLDGGDYRYIIPENQDVLLEYYTAAAASTHTYTKWDSSNLRSGWWIVYQDMWWQVTESGAMFGTDPETWDGICIDADDAAQLYEFCDAEVRAVGIGEPVRPAEITEIKSATLDWNGVHTVTDEYALSKIEKWITNSREEGSVSCWFTAQLTLELENGETKTISMATDSCATWMSEGVAYSYGEVTNVGIEGNEEFFSLFASAIIHEKTKEGPDALTDYWVYTNWRMYANTYSIDETFAFMDMFKEYALSNPTDWIVRVALTTARGLDGAYAQYYAEVVAALYEADPAAFRFACRQMLPEQDVNNAAEMLAYNWNITTQEVRTKLEADIP